jgi:hypothetical protein
MPLLAFRLILLTYSADFRQKHRAPIDSPYGAKDEQTTVMITKIATMFYGDVIAQSV